MVNSSTVLRLESTQADVSTQKLIAISSLDTGARIGPNPGWIANLAMQCDSREEDSSGTLSAPFDYDTRVLIDWVNELFDNLADLAITFNSWLADSAGSIDVRRPIFHTIPCRNTFPQPEYGSIKLVFEGQLATPEIGLLITVINHSIEARIVPSRMLPTRTSIRLRNEAYPPMFTIDLAEDSTSGLCATLFESGKAKSTMLDSTSIPVLSQVIFHQFKESLISSRKAARLKFPFQGGTS